MTTPAEEIALAATEMRRWPGRAAEPLANLLDATADFAVAYPEMAHDHDRHTCDDYACTVMGRTIALARAINGDQP